MSPSRRRPKRLRAKPPPLNEKDILAWMDDHHERTREWPKATSGQVIAVLGENWHALDMALRIGSRGLPGGSSIAKLLARHRGVRNRKALPKLTDEVIAALADIHYWWTGAWPMRKSGALLASPVPSETWARINDALVKGFRGLPGGSSLARLLAKHRRTRNRKGLPPLREEVIVAWADDHFARTGLYPSEKAGRVAAAPGETWAGISMALRSGIRGLPGGSSLFRLLVKHRRIVEIENKPGGHPPAPRYRNA